MEVNTITSIFLVCDECGLEEIPPLDIYNKKEKLDNHNQIIPEHCYKKMRVTILEKPIESFQNIINTEMIYWSIIETVKLHFQNVKNDTKIGDRIASEFQNILGYSSENINRISIYDLYDVLDHVVKKSVPERIDQEIIVQLVTGMIDKAIQNARNRLHENNRIDRSKPVLPGSQLSQDIELVCSVCNEIIDIDASYKKLLLETDDEIDLPKHHNKPVLIRIISQNTPKPTKQKSASSAYNFMETSHVEEMQIISVGIDIGSSTSHLIFSRLDLRREVGFLNMTNRFNIINREILYVSKIIDTPLLNYETIDIDAIVEFCKEEYSNADLTPEQIDTGAVIVTGETAKKENAAEIVERLSDEAGKFVSATAGPNLESILSAMGSGAVQYSKEHQMSILNIDIGGGTSNLALCQAGKVITTACINVGGRLLGIEDDRTIWRIDAPVRKIMEYLGISYNLGEVMDEKDIIKIAETLAMALIDVIKGTKSCTLTNDLLMTELESTIHQYDGIIFSGGVAEMIYGEDLSHNDIGNIISKFLVEKLIDENIIETPNKIRATVIGAGSYSLSVSGSTIYYDKEINFPLINIPVLVIDINKKKFNRKYVIDQISQAFIRYDLIEGDDTIALYFDDPIYARDLYLNEFVYALEDALPNSINNKQLIILIFRTDVGGTIGRTLKQKTSMKNNFISMDEIELHTGDWIDIGSPLSTGDAFPVTIKSLVFNK